MLAFVSPLALSDRLRRPRRRPRGACGLRMAAVSVRLGQSDTYISPIGAGTLSWGDKDRGFGETFNAADTAAAAAYLLEHGVNFLDTAELYGAKSISDGAGAEQLLGDALASASAPAGAVVASKYAPQPWAAVAGVGGGVRLGRAAVRDALRRSLTRLGRASVDLYYLADPAPMLPGLLDGIADCVDDGLVAHVGIANHDVAALRTAHAALADRGIALAANQFKFHLLNQTAVESGLLEETLALGVTPVAYEPLARGLLTGKYTDGEVSPGRKYSLAQLKLYRQLTNLMRFIGATCGGRPRSVSEVALAYCAAKGVVAIPGVNTEGHAREVVRALDWQMTGDVVQILDEKCAYIQSQRVG